MDSLNIPKQRVALLENRQFLHAIGMVVDPSNTGRLYEWETDHFITLLVYDDYNLEIHMFTPMLFWLLNNSDDVSQNDEIS